MTLLRPALPSLHKEQVMLLFSKSSIFSLGLLGLKLLAFLWSATADAQQFHIRAGQQFTVQAGKFQPTPAPADKPEPAKPPVVSVAKITPEKASLPVTVTR